MPIHFACSVCKATYTVNNRNAGQKADCKVCGQRLQVPAPKRLKTVLVEEVPFEPPSPPPEPASPASPPPPPPEPDRPEPSQPPRRTARGPSVVARTVMGQSPQSDHQSPTASIIHRTRTGLLAAA